MSMSVAKKVALPVIYEEAVRDLIACQTLDEAKYFSDKADALAAWAKIYKSDQAGLESKRLKLHAFRRIGELSNELQPPSGRAPKNGPDGKFIKGSGGGRPPGPMALLIAHGLSGENAGLARRIARLPSAVFASFVESEHPPTPRMLRRMDSPVGCQAYKDFTYGPPMQFLTFTRRKPAREMAQQLGGDVNATSKVKKAIIEMQEWLDEFERFLPKAKGGA